MMWNNYFMSGWNGGWWIAVIAIWELYWKGRALWRAAQHKKKEWFVALLVFNTMGILPILYLYVFDKEGAKKGKK